MGHVLVGVDGSKESQAAVRHAEHLARAMSSDLIIACAVGTQFARTSPETASMAESELEEARGNAASVLKDASALLSPGIAVVTKVVDGDAATALSHLAEDAEVEFVVVGHRGRSTLTRALLGSVADRLTQHSPKPVLVVRASPSIAEAAQDGHREAPKGTPSSSVLMSGWLQPSMP